MTMITPDITPCKMAEIIVDYLHAHGVECQSSKYSNAFSRRRYDGSVTRWIVTVVVGDGHGDRCNADRATITIYCNHRRKVYNVTLSDPDALPTILRLVTPAPQDLPLDDSC